MTENTITPYICVDDSAAAIAFYTKVFGAKETLRLTDDTGRVGHAEIAIGAATVMMSDEHPEIGVVSPTTLGNTAVALHLTVADVDAVHERAVEAGASVERPPANQDHGERMFVMRDPFGHRWFVGTPVEDVSFDEMKQRYEAAGYSTVAG
jgi:uncharacterized glyoxalase superfamily protein PhnB